MEKELGKKINIKIISKIGSINKKGEVNTLNKGIYEKIDTYIIDSLKIEEDYTGFIVGIVYKKGKKIAYLVSKRKKIFSAEYLRGKIDFLKPEYINIYIHSNKYNLPITYSNFDDFYYLHENSIYNNMSYCFENIINDSFYYSYDRALCTKDISNKKISYLGQKHTHAHSFEEVVRDLYYFPEYFRVKESEKQFFSDQEIRFLRRMKSYLLAIQLKDIKYDENNNKRIVKSRSRELKKYNLLDVDLHTKNQMNENSSALLIKIYGKKYKCLNESKLLLRNNDIIFASCIGYSSFYDEDEVVGNLKNDPLFDKKYLEDVKEKYLKEIKEYNEQIADKLYVEVIKLKLVEKFNQEEFFKDVV